MNRSSFAVAASFSIAASVAFGSMGDSAAYAVDGGLMRCRRCKGCRWNRGRFRFGLIIPGKSFAAEVQGFVRI